MMTTAIAEHREQHPASPTPKESGQSQAIPLFRFQFQKRYGGLYTNRHDKFVLREEHITELKRLVKEHNGERGFRSEPLSISDIVNTALDFALEHPLAFFGRANPDHLREALGREVYRKAFLHFMRHEIL
jgi:hypothetical protein